MNDLQERLGYHFRDESHLLEALTHPSFCAEKKHVDRDYQRLEFLGDSVIHIAVTTRIFNEFRSLPEGKMTKIRAALSKASTLAEFARRLGVGDHLRIGRGERINKGDQRVSMLCDVFEALIGAMYIDSGYDLTHATTLINALVDDVYQDVELTSLIQSDNPKGKLQEFSQKTYNQTPTYDVLDTSGPDHAKTFTVAVSINDTRYGVGTAGKRQTAEQRAARTALRALEILDDQ